MHSQNKFQAGLSQDYRLECALVVLPGYAAIVEFEQTTQHRNTEDSEDMATRNGGTMYEL